MSIDNETLFECLNEEDFNDFTLFEKVLNKIMASGDKSAFKTVLKKIQFSFLANGDSYRTRVLEKILSKVQDLPIEEILSISSDSLVGNYFALCWISKKEPVINEKTATKYIQTINNLEHLQDVCCFGFPFSDQVLLQLAGEIENLDPNVLKQLSFTAKFLFQLDLLHKSRSMVESFRRIFYATGTPEDILRSNLISALFNKDLKQFSFVLTKFGGPQVNREEDLLNNYFEIWKYLEKLTLPVYYNSDNLRYNGVIFNDNFYFLKYQGIDGIERILFPFDQAPLENIRSIYDPVAMTYYSPNETYGRLKLERIYSFKETETVEKPSIEAITAVKSMTEDEIDDKIRKILEDPNRCPHSPVEVTDIFTQCLYVNNRDDLRWAGIISKGRSFGNLTSQQLTHQVVKACFSPVQIVILVYVNKIQHEALCEFIKLCEFHAKNYCVIDERSLARLFMAYKIF